MMVASAGKFTHYKNSKSYAATVELELSPSSNGTSITVQTDGQGFTRQGYIEEASRNGYPHWKKGAVAGVEYALRVCGNPQYVVVITRIRGAHTDTNPTIVAAAAMNAVWKALSFQPPEELISCIEQKVLNSWSIPLDAVADFC